MSRIGFVSVLFAYAWMSGACSAQETRFEREGWDYIESTHQRFEVNPGDTLTVDAEVGTIRIKSSSTDEAEVLVRKRLWKFGADRARKAFRNVETVIEQTDTGIRIDVDQIDDNASNWFWQDRIQVNIEVTVPLKYNLDLSTVSDDVQTGKIVGSVTVKTLTGNISTGPTEGVLSTKTVSGNIETSRTVGDLHAKSLTGNITIGPVVGDATIGTNSGRIETGSVQEDLHAKSLTGNITIGPVEGDATVTTTTGRMETGSVQGDLHAKSLTGNVKIGPVEGDATVTTTTGNIETSSVDGDLKASSLSGSVKTGPVRSDVTVSTTAGNIETRDILGNVQSGSLSGNISIGAVNGNASASTTSGNIEASNVLGVSETRSLSGDIRLGPTYGGIVASTTSGDIEGELIVTDASVDTRYGFQTRSGDISIILPVDLPAAIDAQIGIGSVIDPWLPTWWHVERHIDSDFVLEARRVESSPGNYRIEAVGERNGGGNDITLVTNDGKIRIRSKHDE